MLNPLIHHFFSLALAARKYDDSERRRDQQRGHPHPSLQTDQADDQQSSEVAEIQRVPRIIAGIRQEEILRQLQSDQLPEAQAALQILYEALFKQLWHVAYRIVRAQDLAEEMVQDVFLSLWEQRQSLVVRDALSLYLHVAIRNRAYDYIRHRKIAERHATAREEDFQSRLGLWPSAMANPEDNLAETEADRALRAALAGISERDRDILILRWREGWSFDEIGQALGLSSVAARTVVTRQQRRLRVFLDRLREELQEP
jgi:RNA polymerase sigma-70 factor (ECF subfamily)